MSIVTFLTDFGLDDNFVGVMKGVILGINPDVRIVDITHNVKPQDITGAAFLLKSSYKFFPKGTIHLVVVDPGVGSRRKAIIVKTKDYIFVGPDNGVLSLALKECRIEKIINITNKKYFLKPVSNTFHGRDVFAPVSGLLSKGDAIGRFGERIKEYKRLEIPKPTLSEGEIIYIDHFGNLVTNIGKAIIKKIQFKGVSINKINTGYMETKKGHPLAIFGSSGNLEISVNQGSAKKYFHAKIGDKVRGEFI